VAVQYKSAKAWKGRRNQRRGRCAEKFPCTVDESGVELRAAGLHCAGIEPIATTSDRVFVLAEKTRLAPVPRAS